MLSLVTEVGDRYFEFIFQSIDKTIQIADSHKN